MKTLRLALLVLPALAPLNPPSAAQEERTAIPSFKDDIDRSIRWLRAQQVRATGAYGAGVADTAVTLIALGESPRAYRRGDGPFVAAALDWLVGRADDEGWIADAGADAGERLRQTQLAAEALGLHQSAAVTDVWTRALVRLGEAGAEPAPELRVPDAEPHELVARATRLLATRAGDGSWTGESDGELGGHVDATAANIVRLARIEALLAPHRPQSAARPAQTLPAFEPADRAAAEDAIERGARFLLTAQLEPGRWGMPGRADAGITAMVVGALLAAPEPRAADTQAAIDAGLAWLVSLQGEDGSIHTGQLPNYTTSAAVLALARAGDPELEPATLRARRFLQALQADEGEGYSEGDRYYGGIGYGGDERPDLSNLQMALEALAASGLESEDPTYAKALRFLERCQNRSETNDVRIEDAGTVTLAGDDGGAAYMPGDSKAGWVELADGTRVPRSYGSMTYALLKCFVFAGVPKDDPRMQAAWEWCREHYTLDVNPGFEHSSDPTAAYQGLFYYFHTMAVALDLYGQDLIVDKDGVEHAWRAEISGRLAAMQDPTDGSWVNHNAPRWWEGNPVLATSYALLALDAALPADR